jgi:hypothetical protein
MLLICFLCLPSFFSNTASSIILSFQLYRKFPTFDSYRVSHISFISLTFPTSLDFSCCLSSSLLHTCHWHAAFSLSPCYSSSINWWIESSQLQTFLITGFLVFIHVCYQKPETKLWKLDLFTSSDQKFLVMVGECRISTFCWSWQKNAQRESYRVCLAVNKAGTKTGGCPGQTKKSAKLYGVYHADCGNFWKKTVRTRQ